MSRRLFVVVTFLALAVACGDDRLPFEGGNGQPESGEVTTTVPAGATTAPPSGSPGTSAAPPGDPSAPPATGSRTPAPQPGEDAIAAAARSGVGGFARTLLRPEPATRLVLDVMSERGAGPSENTLNAAVSTLREVTGKPVATTAMTLSGGKTSWSAADLRALADANAQTPQGDGTAAIRVIFIRGGLEGNDAAVGVAVRGDVLAVFADRVDEASSPLVGRSRMEAAVLVHELGHILGLVDLALDTNRDDPEHPGHSRNSRSVMYWAVESTLVGQALNGPPSTEFDDDDLADLAKLRSGG